MVRFTRQPIVGLVQLKHASGASTHLRHWASLWLLVLLPWLGPTRCLAQSAASRFELLKRGPKEALYRFLYSLPKGADLHSHFNRSNLAEAWLAFGRDPQVTRGNRFYTLARPQLEGLLASQDAVATATPTCPAARGVPTFHTIQHSLLTRLPTCLRGQYVSLADLTDAEQAAFLSSLKLDRPGEGRVEFFDVLGQRIGDMGHDPNLTLTVMVDNVRRLGAEGVRYVEVQVAGPRFFAADGKPLSLDEGTALLRQRINSPEVRATGVVIRFLAAVLRFQEDAEQQMIEAFRLSSAHPDVYVGVGLVGLEQRPGGEPTRFIETIRMLRRRYPGVRLSFHAGETAAPGTQIRDTLLLGATRIGHGINLLSDPATYLLMKNREYLIEISLLSNQVLEYVPDIQQHPFPEYLRTGIPVSLNTDDRGSWDSNITDEFYTAVTEFNLTWNEVCEITRNSLRYSFVEPAVKARLLRLHEAALRQAETRLLSGGAGVSDKPAVISGYAKRRWGL